MSHASPAPGRVAPAVAETSVREGRTGRRAAAASQWADRIAGLAIGTQILLKAVDKLPYFSRHPFLVGFLYAASGAVAYVLTPENRTRVGRRFFRSVDRVPLLAGAALGVFTALGDRDPWAFGIGGLFLAIGLSMTLLTDRMLKRFDCPGHA